MIDTLIGLPRVMTGVAVSLVNKNFPSCVIRALLDHRRFSADELFSTDAGRGAPCVHLFPQMQPPLVRPNPPFVAFRVSALRRAAIMARMLRDASRSSLLPATAQLLSPRLASMLFPPILVPALIGELSFAV